MVGQIDNKTNKIIEGTFLGLQLSDGKPLELEALSIDNVIQKAVDSYKYKSGAAKNLVVKIENNFRFNGNRDLAINTIYSLIENSFSDLQAFPHAVVTIGTRKGNNCNVVFIHNTAFGLPKSKIEEYSKTFSAAANQENATGITLCAKIIRMFGGQIKCRSEEGSYTEYALLFPFLKEEETEIKKTENNIPSVEKVSILSSQAKDIVPPASAGKYKAIKILLADDQEASLIMVKSLLEKYFDATCDLASNGRDAVQKISENSYNMVLIDLQMPLMDGISAAKEIRKLNKEIILITYSTSIDDAKRSEIKAAGFNDLLPWPLRHNILLRTVAKWLLIKEYWFGNQPTEERVTESLRDKTLLLVDDQDLNRVLIASHLVKNYDIVVDQASNGKEALEKFTAKAKSGHPYDLVFMDCKMPIMDGYEATRGIRKYQEENNIGDVPIVAITGDGDRDSVNRIFEAGMDDYFIKGDNYDNVTKIIMLWTNIVGEGNIYNEKISIAKESLQSGVINKSYGEILPQIIPIFLKDGEALINDMKAAKETKDIKKLAFLAHAFKGVCGNMKAERLYKLCSYISDMAKQNKWPTDEDWMKEVEKTFADTKEELEKYKV